MPANIKKEWWGAAALLFLGLIAYGPTLHAGVVWDDDFHFASNPHMRSLAGLVEIWTSRAGLYYPLTLTSFWFILRIFGLSPFILHAVNFAWHLGAAFTLWALLRRLKLPGGWLASLLFLVHPVNVETVAWITEMKNTQSTFFYLLSLLALAPFDADDAPSWRRTPVRCLIGFGFFGLAVLSKSSTVMLPATLLLLQFWRRGLRSWRDALWTAPFFALALLTAAWTIWEQRYNSGASGFEWSQDFVSRLALAGHVSWFYLAKLAWPHPLIFIYPRWTISTDQPLSFLPLAALAIGLMALALFRRPWSRAVLVAWLFYLINLFPVMGFFDIYFTRYSFVADHFAYLPLVGFFVLIGVALTRFGQAVPSADASTPAPILTPRSWPVRLPIAAMFACLLAGPCMVLTLLHARAFRNEEALWMDTLAKNPGAWMVHNNLGASLLGRGDLDGAELHFREALRYNPRHYEALCNLGNVLLQRGQPAESIAYFNQAVALKPDFALAWVNLGLAHDRTGAADRAMECYRYALEQDPGFLEAYVKMAGIYERQGKVTDALAAFQKALDLHGASEIQRADFFMRRSQELSGQEQAATAAAYQEEARRLAGRAGPSSAP